MLAAHAVRRPRSAVPSPASLLSYRPLREIGDRITLTHTNRDYLGVITAIGAEAAPRGAVRGRHARRGDAGTSRVRSRDACELSGVEHELAARVIDTLLREDYAGLSRRVRTATTGRVL